MGHPESLRQAIYASLDRKAYASAEAGIACLSALGDDYETEALGLTASVAIERGDSKTAEATVERLIARAPEDAYTIFLSCRVAFMRGETVEPARRLTALSASDAFSHVSPAVQEKVYNLLGQCCRFLGRSAAATEAYLAATEAAKGTGQPHLVAIEYSDYLFNTHYLPPAPPAVERARAAAYATLYGEVTPFAHRRRAPLDASRKLRIGYLSADFRDHVVLRFCAALLTAYDHARFEVFAYMCGTPDAYSEQIAARVDGWRQVDRLSPQALARVIYEDEIDILVDLAGHTRENRLLALLYRPAPILVSGIGYFASTGIPTVDYFLGDVRLDDAETAAAFTEKLLVLPHSHFCYTPLYGGREIPLPSLAPCERKGYVTFGSLNNFTKVTDEVLHAWAEILRRVPTAHLFLKAEVFDRTDSRADAISRMVRAGIDLTRVAFEGITKAYYSAYAKMDIALDTFPYPGGGTTCDALYMGVPVVTLAVPTHGGRFGKSLLENIGLSELVTDSVEAYISRAVALAEDAPFLALLRQRIRPMMEASHVMDAARYMRDVEDAYIEIYEKYVAEAAQDIPPPQEVTALCKKAAALAAANDLPQALALSDRVLLASSVPRAQAEQLAERYIDAGEVARAAEAVAHLHTEKKPYGYGLFLAASAAYLAGDDAAAREKARLALGRFGASLLPWQRGATHHLLAEVEKRAGNRTAAAAEYLASSRYKDASTGQYAEYSNYLLNLHYDEHPAEEMRAAAEGYGALFARTRGFTHTKKQHAHKKLRIGYLSPDFCRHVVAGFAKALFTHADRTRFEIYGYASGTADDVTKDFAWRADTWRRLDGMTTEEAAKCIYEDEIDILVELAGHTGNNGLPILAFRPAPVQLVGIGYFATTGLSAVDGFLTDVHAAPQGEEAWFTEPLCRLEHSHLCYVPLDASERPVSPAPCLQNGYITFGSLNQFDKVTDEVLSAWAEILRRVPTARLFLKAGAFDNAARRASILARLQAAGFDASRVAVEGYTADYYAAYDKIDIALDSYPYPGGGTTCDALYRGVPVLTRYGTHHHERFGYSLLVNLGLTEFAAASWESYIDRAVLFAQDLPLLAALRARMRDLLVASPVMDAKLYMRDVETMYDALWRSNGPR